MNSIALKTLETTSPFGRTIAYAFSNLTKGSYALLPDEKNGRTKLLKKTKSAGTDFYRYLFTVNFPFRRLKESNLIPSYHIELNASPAGSDSQEYRNALVFHV